MSFTFEDYTPNDQIELSNLSNAVQAALSYAPGVRVRHDNDVYAYVTRQFEKRFWRDIYVDRPEIREIMFRIQTGQLVIVTGERGTGKSTAVAAVTRELNRRASLVRLNGGAGEAFVHALDLAPLIEELMEIDNVEQISSTICQGFYDALAERLVDDPDQWRAFLYESFPSFAEFRLSVEAVGPRPSEAFEWTPMASHPAHEGSAQAGMDLFAMAPYMERLRALLSFADEKLGFEPFLLIEGADRLPLHMQRECTSVLASVIEGARGASGAIVAAEQDHEMADHAKGCGITVVSDANLNELDILDIAQLQVGNGKLASSPGPPIPPNILVYVLDANRFTEELNNTADASITIHREVYNALTDRTSSWRSEWLAYLYAKSDAFENLKMALEHEGPAPKSAEEWISAASRPEHRDALVAGRERFTGSSYSDRLRTMLAFISSCTYYEPLIIIDNVDHLPNDVQCHCAKVLFSIVKSTDYRVRAAIAVRPENYDAIVKALDTTEAPPRIEMAQASTPVVWGALRKPTIEVTRDFIAKRLAVLREPQTVEQILSSMDIDSVSRLAEDAKLTPSQGVTDYLEALRELLDLMVYDVFSTDESEHDFGRENRDMAEAMHLWHNGSLRECALSLTTFVSKILLNQTDMYQLRTLLVSVVNSRGEPQVQRRRKLRRITRSLLYRHLLFESSSDSGPSPSVMVFDGLEEETKPPIHFLRMRILQYLSQRQRGKASVKGVRRTFRLLGVKDSRTEEALRELATPRTVEDTGLINIDRLRELPSGAQLPDDASVQLLEAGQYLVDTLYVSTEYLFWSAVSLPAARHALKLRKQQSMSDVQSDAFRAKVAARFVELYLVERFRDEHPYLVGLSDEWTKERSHERMLLYQRLFGFSRKRWLLNSCCDSMRAFIPSSRQGDEFAPALESIDRVKGFASTLDSVMGDAPPA